MFCSKQSQPGHQMWASEVAENSHSETLENLGSALMITHSTKWLPCYLERWIFFLLCMIGSWWIMSVAETQGEKGDSSLKIALLKALRESIFDTDRKKGRRGQELVTKCSECVGHQHWFILSYCPLLRMTPSFALILTYKNPLKLYNYLEIKLIGHYLYFNNLLGKCFLSFFFFLSLHTRLGFGVGHMHNSVW